MNLKSLISNLVGTVGKFCTSNSPTLLTVAGLGFGATTVVLTAKKAPEAKIKKEEVIRKAKKENKGKLETAWEVTKATTPVYIWPIVTGVAAGACIVSSDIIVNKRLTKTAADLASVTAGYFALQNKFNDYKKTADEVIGEAKRKDLDRKAIERQQENSEQKEENAYPAKLQDEGDKQLCYDVWSDRYFRASVDDLRKAENKVNLMLFANDEATLNDWYEEVGLPSIQSAEGWGWTASACALKGGIDLDIGCCLSPNNTPCASVDFSTLLPLWKSRK